MIIREIKIGRQASGINPSMLPLSLGKCLIQKWQVPKPALKIAGNGKPQQELKIWVQISTFLKTVLICENIIRGIKLSISILQGMCSSCLFSSFFPP